MAKVVCIVDDDEIVREKIAIDLQSMGFETIEIDDSREVPAVLSTQPVDVVLVDIVMPDKDGVEVIAEIRNRWPQMRVVAMSAGGRVGPSLYLNIARQMGASVCLEKPLQPELLREAIG
jgi:DNA-binding NtrC family response regulator